MQCYTACGLYIREILFRNNRVQCYLVLFVCDKISYWGRLITSRSSLSLSFCVNSITFPPRLSTEPQDHPVLLFPRMGPCLTKPRRSGPSTEQELIGVQPLLPGPSGPHTQRRVNQCPQPYRKATSSSSDDDGPISFPHPEECRCLNCQPALYDHLFDITKAWNDDCVAGCRCERCMKMREAQMRQKVMSKQWQQEQEEQPQWMGERVPFHRLHIARNGLPRMEEQQQQQQQRCYRAPMPGQQSERVPARKWEDDGIFEPRGSLERAAARSQQGGRLSGHRQENERRFVTGPRGDRDPNGYSRL